MRALVALASVTVRFATVRSAAAKAILKDVCETSGTVEQLVRLCAAAAIAARRPKAARSAQSAVLVATVLRCASTALRCLCTAAPRHALSCGAFDAAKPLLANAANAHDDSDSCELDRAALVSAARDLIELVWCCATFYSRGARARDVFFKPPHIDVFFRSAPGNFVS